MKKSGQDHLVNVFNSENIFTNSSCGSLKYKTSLSYYSSFPHKCLILKYTFGIISTFFRPKTYTRDHEKFTFAVASYICCRELYLSELKWFTSGRENTFSVEHLHVSVSKIYIFETESYSFNLELYSFVFRGDNYENELQVFGQQVFSFATKKYFSDFQKYVLEEKVYQPFLHFKNKI